MIGGLQNPLTTPIQNIYRDKIMCSWMEKEISSSPMFPIGVIDVNSTYPSSQSENSAIQAHFCIFFISSWPPLPSAYSRVCIYVLIGCKEILQHALTLSVYCETHSENVKFLGNSLSKPKGLDWLSFIPTYPYFFS